MKRLFPLFVFLALFAGLSNGQTAIAKDNVAPCTDLSPSSDCCPAEGKTDDSRATIVDLLRQELDYRRSMQWNVFSWCSTILIAIAGGVIALQRTSSLHIVQQGIVSFAVAGLATYGYFWINHHMDRENQVRKCITNEVKAEIWPPRSHVPGDRVTIIVLGSAALVVTWFRFGNPGGKSGQEKGEKGTT
jgi:hypothetical protein